ncbi:hypothetical protein BKA69DRAFT_1126588 [Paraphysoderma sedebokerense]|nr:hypothetical protein BKA69DRAFT_1126588 [Paraphysoderma sedebokerense]
MKVRKLLLVAIICLFPPYITKAQDVTIILPPLSTPPIDATSIVVPPPPPASTTEQPPTTTETPPPPPTTSVPANDVTSSAAVTTSSSGAATSNRPNEQITSPTSGTQEPTSDSNPRETDRTKVLTFDKDNDKKPEQSSMIIPISIVVAVSVVAFIGIGTVIAVRRKRARQEQIENERRARLYGGNHSTGSSSASLRPSNNGNDLSQVVIGEGANSIASGRGTYETNHSRRRTGQQGHHVGPNPGARRMG